VCTYLEDLNLEEVTHLSVPSLASLILTRKETLKKLLLDGELVTDDFFRHLSRDRFYKTLIRPRTYRQSFIKNLY
jgi:hypothetical protein